MNKTHKKEEKWEERFSETSKMTLIKNKMNYVLIYGFIWRCMLQNTKVRYPDEVGGYLIKSGPRMSKQPFGDPPKKQGLTYLKEMACTTRDT